ncbi:hypothetical protein EVG20_g7120 [Dentipellis fragilis]|uniref:Uncharacterized protein n=1 Tax=Dentipellis fragilis TaxID=205917 RepID=A0A4Y9YGY9_9AGAM|nr:hypothetical protein EVG20_g7120 [Dentipellis fragilis]
MEIKFKCVRKDCALVMYGPREHQGRVAGKKDRVQSRSRNYAGAAWSMPRLIPRLLKRLQSLPSSPSSPRIAHLPPKTKKWLSPHPQMADYTHAGRSDSILLDSSNPILHRKDYERHKDRPRFRLHPSRNTSMPAAEAVEESAPRVMSEMERVWWANPYLRMLSSPIRKCVVTSKQLPSDFLIRMSPRRLPSPRVGRNTYAMLPDGLEHPKFKQRYSGNAYYASCRQAAVDEIIPRGVSRLFHQHYTVLPSLGPYIGHLLRLRVLQELELLGNRLQYKKRNSEHIPVLRRLTRVEFKDIKETGVIPFDHAVAVLVVPPLNRDPVHKDRPTPNKTSFPDDEAQQKSTPTRPSPPLSTLYPVAQDNDYDDLPDTVSSPKVPLYNGISLFPSRPQRAALHKLLTRLLKVEYLNIRKTKTKSPHRTPWVRTSGDDKASHAFLLCSSPNNLERADAAPLAIALWRLRMWEGKPWRTEVGTWASVVRV